MQVQLPFSRAVETLEAMRSFPHPPKIVIVTMFESPRYIRELTGVGVSAYLLKTTSADHLVAAVRAAVFDPGSENTVIGMPPEMLEETGRGAEGVLSARELEILLLVARGLSNAADSLLAVPRRGHRKAPPGQRLHQDGRPLQGRGFEGGAP